MAERISKQRLRPFLVYDQLIESSTIVRSQMLAELEEIIEYKQSDDLPSRQEAIRSIWHER